MNSSLAPVIIALAGVALCALDTSVALAQEGRSKSYDSVDVVLLRVPEKVRAKRNPFESDPEAPTAGKKLFGQHCAECHGETADGARRGPSLRAEHVENATPGEIFWIVTNGVVRRGMPAWSKLPEQQRWQIITFLRLSGGMDRTKNGGV